MKFEQREWVTEIVTSTFAGAIAGAVAALFVPDQSILMAAAAGGTGGLVVGFLNMPLKWLVERLH
jgi:uncharacterized membrane protein YeaQ/YmgE (transglycosylase-associated protein family)